jgi:predicted ArsR family transcriptional regulator
VHAATISSDAPGTGRERVLFVLKTKGPQTAARMAKRLGVTYVDRVEPENIG